MPETLTFIHAADLHIGAPFRGLRALSDEWARRLVDAIPGAWDRVVEAAVSRKIDFVVVSGDIFDSVRASYRDYLRFFDGLNRLDAEGIPSYLCTGNHDPLSLWQQDFFALPPSATMLAADRPDFALYERDGRPLAVIGGRGYPNKVWSPNENIAEGITRAAAIRALGPRAAEAPFCGGRAAHRAYVRSCEGSHRPRGIAARRVRLLALGHIHKRWVNDERAPRIAFSGCIQGRDVRETGPRGVNLVTLAVDAPPKVSFIPTASVVWEKVRIDVSDCTNIPALVSKTMRELFAVNGDASCEMMVSRIILTGATSLHEVLGRPGVLEEVRASLNDAYSEFYCDSLIDETTAPIDEEALRAEGLFPAVFLRTVDRLSEDVEGQIDYLQEEYLARNVPLTAALSEKKARQLTNEAARLVLDLLLQGGDDR